ncbi:NAD(P)/FAD-dependent oxidoreductase [Marinicella sp. W31]|uniref:NAD(P)/FAD-dependent oxidoreductase n=1 Tax=Marinicella sp. W31 TaxID=3023713 RepID=UPI003756D6EF
MSSPSLVVENSLLQQQSMSTKVVIIGAGFAGLTAAKKLRKSSVHVTLIDQRNYHLFQPLLYQVATAGLSPADISMPIRRIVRHQDNCHVLMDKVIGVDGMKKCVITENFKIAYDYLIIATGSQHSYFGNDNWEGIAPGLKNIDDATEIRRRILLAFEQAETTENAQEKKRLLTFVVVGAGPTGVEMAGTIAELAKKTLSPDFKNISPSDSRVLLIEAGPRVLSSFPEKLSDKALKQLHKLGVEVMIGRAMTSCSEDCIVIADQEKIPIGQLIWAAGVQASPAAEWLGLPADKVGRVKVTPHLQAPGLETVFVIGDTAAVLDKRWGTVPGVAPAAKQMGKYVARQIDAQISNKSKLGPFVYKDYGQLATIGRKAAVADFGKMKFSGFFAWLLWGIVHVFFLIGFRNRVSVMLNWMWQYLFFSRGARLITGNKRRRSQRKNKSKDKE